MLQALRNAVPFAVWCIQPDIIAVFETYAVNICNLGVHCAEAVGQCTEMVPAAILASCNPAGSQKALLSVEKGGGADAFAQEHARDSVQQQISVDVSAIDAFIKALHDRG